MEEVARNDRSITIRCSKCARELQTPIYEHAVGKIIANAADGERKDQLHYFGNDALQPIDERGGENEHFTRKYGYNPAAKDPDKRINPNEAVIGSGQEDPDTVPDSGSPDDD